MPVSPSACLSAKSLEFRSYMSNICPEKRLADDFTQPGTYRGAGRLQCAQERLQPHGSCYAVKHIPTCRAVRPAVYRAAGPNTKSRF